MITTPILIKELLVRINYQKPIIIFIWNTDTKNECKVNQRY